MRRCSPVFWLLAGLCLLLVAGCSALPPPSPSLQPPQPTASASPPTPSPSAQATPTALVTPTPLPAPAYGDEFVSYEVEVGPATYVLYQFDASGSVTATLSTTYTGFSHAEVREVIVKDPFLRYWQLINALPGWAFRFGRSGSPFQIWEIYQSPDGARRAIVLSDDQL